MPSVDLTGVTLAAASRAPLSSLHLTLKTLGDGGTGSRFGQKLSASLTADMRHALSPMIAAAMPSGVRRMSFPSVMTPVLDESSSWADDAADAIADTSPDELRDGLMFMTGGRSTDRWRTIEERPREWLHAVSAAMRVANGVFNEVWAATTARRELELHLLDQLVVAGAAPRAVTDLVPAIKVDSRRLTVGDADGLTVVAQPLLELVPMVTYPGGYLVSSGANRVQVGYTIRGVLASTVPERASGDHLGVLLGDVRAAMLRTLDRPRAMSELAGLVRRAPSTVTVHARLMLDAGLAERIELGNRAWLVRTERGAELLRLFDHDGL